MSDPSATPPRAVKTRSADLDPQADARAALAAIVGAAAAQLAANRAALAAGYEVECIHQLRVGARRLRSALKLFGRRDPAVRRPPFLPALHELIAHAGAARDLDVLLDRTLPRLAAGGNDPSAVAELARHYDGERHRAQARILEALADPRCAALLLAIDGWTAGLPVLDSPALAVPIARLAPRLLARAARRLRRRGRHLAGLSPADRHTARIAAKQLRYAGEFLASLYPADAVHPWLHALAQLQDTLGDLNDLATLDARLFAEPPTGHASATARVRTLAAAAGAQALATLDAQWRDWRAIPAFWERED